ncbi:hypothetical protein [Rhizobium sp. BK251]|uniref:hypothetical protein n=1 Tax=Rhizobium sp. BK251 TaxID=2512125 RepID=UPI00105256EE|nr:hypothetical protein [Rhizobium sp. BK251]TCL69765.1 hypothetical protein EV286_108340 [Rhizobium sp. BK251]
MIEALLKLGLPVAIAALLTTVAVVWIEPASWGGMTLIFFVLLAASYILIKIFAWVAGAFR